MATGAPDSSQWEWAAMEPELTEREKELRNLFVNELLVDETKPVEAALRCGFQIAFAKDYAMKFLNEAYVQKRIQEVRHIKVDAKIENEYDEQTIRSVLRREMQNQFGSPAARVSAAAKLQELIDRDKEAALASKGASGVRGGVLLVPMIANVDEWEAVAMASQAKLVADVRS